MADLLHNDLIVGWGKACEGALKGIGRGFNEEL